VGAPLLFSTIFTLSGSEESQIFILLLGKQMEFFNSCEQAILNQGSFSASKERSNHRVTLRSIYPMVNPLLSLSRGKFTDLIICLYVGFPQAGSLLVLAIT